MILIGSARRRRVFYRRYSSLCLDRCLQRGDEHDEALRKWLWDAFVHWGGGLRAVALLSRAKSDARSDPGGKPGYRPGAGTGHALRHTERTLPGYRSSTRKSCRPADEVGLRGCGRYRQRLVARADNPGAMLGSLCLPFRRRSRAADEGASDTGPISCDQRRQRVKRGRLVSVWSQARVSSDGQLRRGQFLSQPMRAWAS